MAIFALYVQSSTYASPVLASVLRFAQAAIIQNHRLEQIFFYQDAVHAISAGIDLPADEPDIAAELITFCHQHHIPLLYCVTAAEKRGLANQHSPARTGFIAAGLAEFAMRLDAVDQVVQF